jgi:hypothetical protein
MSEWDLVLGFITGIIAGAYGAYLAHPIIEGGVTLMKLNKEQQKIEEALKTTNAETNDATQPDATNTTPHPTQEQNHSTTTTTQTKKLD